MHPKVAEYFKKQPARHQEILGELRALIFKTFPDIEEGFLWGVPVYNEGRFYLASLKKQVNLGFSIIGLTKEEIKAFVTLCGTGGSGKTTRHIKVYNLLESEQKEKIVELLKLVKQKAGIPK